jgi:hypothetical protein
MKIIHIIKSDKKDKRFKVFLDDGEEYDFGLKNPNYGTYIDHKNKDKRFNYWARHYGNKKEKELIDNLEPSNALFSAFLLWGKYDNLRDNVEHLNYLFEKYY